MVAVAVATVVCVSGELHSVDSEVVATCFFSIYTQDANSLEYDLCLLRYVVFVLPGDKCEIQVAEVVID